MKNCPYCQKFLAILLEISDFQISVSYFFFWLFYHKDCFRFSQENDTIKHEHDAVFNVFRKVSCLILIQIPSLMFAELSGKKSTTAFNCLSHCRDCFRFSQENDPIKHEQDILFCAFYDLSRLFLTWIPTAMFAELSGKKSTCISFLPFPLLELFSFFTRK